MLNMMRMDLYRLFKSKSMYVIWIITACFLLFSTYMSQEEYREYGTENGGGQVQEQMEEEPVNLGMSVELPTQPGDKVTVFDEFYGNAQGKVLALFIVIFTILFSSADNTSGYIKNVAGQVEHRGKLILSKVVAILLYVVMTFGLCVMWQALCHRLMLGYVKMGDLSHFGKYFAVQMILHFALALVCMAITILVRNNVVSMIFGVCLCMNFQIVIYGVVDKWIQKLGQEDFSILQYTVTRKISLLPMDVTGKECASALLISAVFIVVMTALTGLVFEKRDIV